MKNLMMLPQIRAALSYDKITIFIDNKKFVFFALKCTQLHCPYKVSTQMKIPRIRNKNSTGGYRLAK